MEISKITKDNITIYRIVNASGASVELSSLGAGILSICVPDANGTLADVVLGYDNPADYLADGPCAGKIPGRYANRIGQGKLHIDGADYQLAINNGPNHLHGGPTGFQNRIWNSEVEGDYVVFTYRSANGEENYPGNLTARVAYRWSDDNQLDIALSATTDAPTAVNLTNHVYFNLAGHNAGSVLNHTLQLCCANYLPTDANLCPTGEILSVANTPMDFTTAKPLARDFNADFQPLKFGKGYDACFVIDNYLDGVLAEAATLADPQSGRFLKVFTDQPGIQIYTGNWLDGCPTGKGAHQYHDYDGVALECQGFPDAPNHPNFPSQILRPGKEYRRNIVFAFKTMT